MSTSNIVSIIPIGAAIGALGAVEFGEIGEVVGGNSILVTFKTRNGEITYQYDGDAADAILAGDDPKNWNGTRVE